MSIIAVLETTGFVAAFPVAAWLWRARPSALWSVTTQGGFVALTLLTANAVVGIPLALCRLGRLSLAPDLLDNLSWVHRHLSHGLYTAFILYWPFLFVLSVVRTRGVLRKASLGAASVLSFGLFLLVAFSGYLLPRGLPRVLSPLEARQVLRFVVLHVVAVPWLAITLLGIVIWRHVTAKKRVPKGEPGSA